MGIFIEISVDAALIDAQTARKVVDVCPVDIYALDGDRLAVLAEQEDECTLCRLCLDTAPPRAIRIRKTYADDVLIRSEADAS